MSSRTEKQMEALLTVLTKEFGKESAMMAEDIPDFQPISTGSLSLDFATGVGGIPHNRVIEIFGREGLGKTTLAAHIVNNFLKTFPDRIAIYIDVENRLTKNWIANFIEDMDRLIVVKPDSMEQATKAFVEACKTKKISVVVVDSIGGAPTEAALTRDPTQGEYGGNAKAVTAFAKFAQTMGKYDVCTIGINQERDDLSGYHKIVTPGGTGWKHACSLRIRLKKGDKRAYAEIDGQKVQVGNVITASIMKNSVGAPFKVASYWFYNIPTEKFGFGIDTAHELTDLAILTGVVEKNASMYVHPLLPGGKVRGKDAFQEYVMGNKDAFDQITKATMDALKEDSSAIITTVRDENDDNVEERYGLSDRDLDEENEDSDD